MVPRLSGDDPHSSTRECSAGRATQSADRDSMRQKESRLVTVLWPTVVSMKHETNFSGSTELLVACSAEMREVKQDWPSQNPARRRSTEVTAIARRFTGGSTSISFNSCLVLALLFSLQCQKS
jgi:hypothetical protein